MDKMKEKEIEKVKVKRPRRLPFTCVDNRIFKDEQITVQQLAVYVVLCYHADSINESCYPSYSTIAREAKISRRAVMRAIDALIKAGYIKKQGRKLDGTNSQTSNLYTITSEVVTHSHQVVSDSHQGGDTVSLGVVTDSHPNKNHLNKNQLTKLFKDFYSLYPKKVSKDNASKAFLKLKPDNEFLKVMIDAIEKQKTWREEARRSGLFVPEWPYPATWLNQKRWEDEIDVREETANPFA